VQYDIDIGGRIRRVVVQRLQGSSGTFTVTIDGREWKVDAERIDGRSLSLLVEDEGRHASHEVTVSPDPSGPLIVSVGSTQVALSLNGARRSRRRSEGGHAAAGPLRIVAPMPGKIVRVLVKPGDEVRARQSLVVIEAMKMENELRAGRDGLVAEMHAREGQSVEAGVLLAVIAARPEPSQT
jgi:biotin carboxyl carrier protein